MMIISIILILLSIISVIVFGVLLIVRLAAKKGLSLKSNLIFLGSSFLVFIVAIVMLGGSVIKESGKTMQEIADRGEEITGLSSDSKSEENKDKKESGKKKEKKEATDDQDREYYADALHEEVEYLTEGQAELSEESYNFIKKNSNLFPAKSKKNIQNAKELAETIDVKLLNKNIQPYYSSIVQIEGIVIQIEEQNYDNGETVALVNVLDNDWNNHHIILYKATDDILEDDYVSFIGLPIAKYNYETLDGGSQNAIMFFGAHIEKSK